ncbi:MAG: NUDIX domain-containing protein [Paracoccaceae bacterium]
MTPDIQPDLIPAWVGGKLQPVDKLQAHLQGLRHKAVSVFLMRGDALLLQRRAAGKYHSALLWANSCCTHPHWDEAPLDCAHRRMRQELGVTGLDLHPAGQLEYRAEVGGGMVEHELVDLFRAEAPGDLAPHPDPAEVADLRWMRLEDLDADLSRRPQDYTAWLRIYLQQHGAQIFGSSAPR